MKTKRAKMREMSENRSAEIVPMDRSHHKDAIVFVRLRCRRRCCCWISFVFFLPMCEIGENDAIFTSTALQMCLRLIQFG